MARGRASGKVMATMDTPPPDTPQAPVRRVERSGEDRVVAGVCGGLGRHFAVDPTLFRLGAVVLAFAGGIGLVAYLAAWMLMPSEEGTQALDARRPLTVAGAVVLGVAAVVVLSGPLWGVAAALVPLVLLALLGLGTWWLVSGTRPEGGAAELGRALLLGLLMVGGLAALALAAFSIAAAGGAVVVAAVVLGAGVLLVAAALAGRGRALLAPALAVALPAAFVAAAGLEIDGGVGDRTVRPAGAVDLRDAYAMGIGQLVVDLRGVDLGPGDRRLAVEVGIGHALVLVDEDVCVAARTDLGLGGVNILGREGGGVDVAWEDLPAAPPGVTRLLLDADVGIGAVEVGHDRRTRWSGSGGEHRDGWSATGAGNEACADA